jgi:uncharacterized membrane protein YdjX (TVP38/TMEM64 family)
VSSPANLARVFSTDSSPLKPQEANDAVLTLREYESWAWALGIALIWADVVLPVPQTAVIAALGMIYGTLLGALLGTLGLITGGLLGYLLMLTSARRYVQRFVGPQSLHTLERLFDQRGAWAIVLTRSFPYSVPEAMVFLAGLAGMPTGKFVAALTIGRNYRSPCCGGCPSRTNAPRQRQKLRHAMGRSTMRTREGMTRGA